MILAEPGNSFAWAINQLRFNQPNRFRTSTGFASMGHTVTGVVGAALGGNRKAISIVGDGAMLMNCEINTAVKYQIPAIWIVLNDGQYNMCEQGMALQGFKGVDVKIPQVDFVQLARVMRADGICVDREYELVEALEEAISSDCPFVVDVRIEANQIAPIGTRIQSLIAQGSK